MEPVNKPGNPDQPQQPPLEANPYPPPPPLFNDAPPPPPQHGPGIPPPPASGSPSMQYNNSPATPSGAISKDERNWAMFAHLSTLVGAIVIGALSAGTLTFLAFLGPLVIYFMKKDESPFVADQAKEALNFSISVCIMTFGLIVLSFTIILMILTIPMLALLGIGSLILAIIAAMKASEGTWYRYPFTLRLIK